MKPSNLAIAALLAGAVGCKRELPGTSGDTVLPGTSGEFLDTDTDSDGASMIEPAMDRLSKPRVPAKKR